MEIKQLSTQFAESNNKDIPLKTSICTALLAVDNGPKLSKSYPHFSLPQQIPTQQDDLL